MTHDMDTELTPEEREAFLRLPREAAPSELLEERVVRNLRARRLLSPRRTPWRRAGQMAAGLAAALALFLGGTMLGQWRAGRTPAGAAQEPARAGAAVTASQVQQAGSAYVAALASLHAQWKPGSPEAGKSGSLTQGREAALSALRAAAGELARMDPNDPRVAAAFQALEQTPAEGAEPAAAPGSTRQILWF